MWCIRSSLILFGVYSSPLSSRQLGIVCLFTFFFGGEILRPSLILGRRTLDINVNYELPKYLLCISIW